MRTLRVLAPAKVNLLLRVERPPRPDGYHNVTTVLQTVSLADEVEVRVSRGGGISAACDHPEVPRDRTNLAVRAARHFMTQPGLPEVAVTIGIRKRIPLRAGLGGGSSNAAAVLVALRALVAPEMPDGLLESLGADLGADVPFFIRGGTQLGIGRGDLLSPVEPALAEGVPLVIVKPEASCDTPAVYAAFDRTGPPSGPLPPPGDAVRSLTEGDLAQSIRNDLTEAACEVAPAIRSALDALRQAGLPAWVSGSGSACFGVADSPDRADTVADALRREFPFAVACSTRTLGCEVLRDNA